MGGGHDGRLRVVRGEPRGILAGLDLESVRDSGVGLPFCVFCNAFLIIGLRMLISPGPFSRSCCACWMYGFRDIRDGSYPS